MVMVNTEEMKCLHIILIELHFVQYNYENGSIRSPVVNRIVYIE